MGTTSNTSRGDVTMTTSVTQTGEEIRPQTLSSSFKTFPVTTSDTLLTEAPTQTDMDKPRPFNCEQCGKNFITGASLRDHQHVHTGEKPYHCKQCGKTFSRQDHLKTHQRLHTGEKPYHCEQCEKKFSREDHLRKHQRVHTGEKPYHCEQCGKSFSQESSLRT